MAHSTELLRQGREILEPSMLALGFKFEPGTTGVGSGGPFARGAYARGRRRLEFSVRWTLGDVIHRAGDVAIPHEELMRAVAGAERGKYPGFSNDPLDAFRHLRADLEMHASVVLQATDEEFRYLVERARAAQPRTGFARLSDSEASEPQ